MVDVITPAGEARMPRLAAVVLHVIEHLDEQARLAVCVRVAEKEARERGVREREECEREERCG